MRSGKLKLKVVVGLKCFKIVIVFKAVGSIASFGGSSVAGLGIRGLDFA